MLEIKYGPNLVKDRELYPLVENASRLMQVDSYDLMPELTADWDIVQPSKANGKPQAILKLKNDVIEEFFVLDRRALDELPTNPSPIWSIMGRFFIASSGKRLRTLRETESPVGV